jgi:hypothetical protein
MLPSHLGQGDLDLSCAAQSQHPALLVIVIPFQRRQLSEQATKKQFLSHQSLSFFRILSPAAHKVPKSVAHWQPSFSIV